MSLSEYFEKECETRIKDNVRLAWSKLSDPLSMINLQVSSPLIEKALSSQGGFSDFVSKTIEENGGLITVSALGLLSDSDQANIRRAFNLASSVVAAAVVAHNDVLLIFVKKIARNAVSEIDKKRKKAEEIKKTANELKENLQRLSASNKEFMKYLAQIKSALALITSANVDLTSVKGAYAAKDIWLSAKFLSAKNKFKLAKGLILPESDRKKNSDVFVAAKNAVSDFYFSTASRSAGLQEISNWGLPSDQEQILAFKKIPLLARKLLIQTQDYAVSAITLNALLASYKLALVDLKSALPSFLKTFTIGLLDKLIGKGLGLQQEISGVIGANPKDPMQPTKIVVYSATWGAQLALLLGNFDIIPDKGNKDISLDSLAVAEYERSVAYLKTLGTVGAAGARLFATEAEEDIAAFDTQAAVLGLTALDSLLKSDKRVPAAQLALALTSRIDLGIKRDEDIKSALRRFITVKLPLESILEDIAGQLPQLLKGMGFDNAAGALTSGKFSKFFKLNARDATTVGAGLTAISYLKKCFPSAEDQEKLSDLQTALERKEDLLNFKLSVDFDLAIFKNLEECVKFTNLASFAKIKEGICGILTDEQKKAPNAVGRILQRLPV